MIYMCASVHVIVLWQFTGPACTNALGDSILRPAGWSLPWLRKGRIAPNMFSISHLRRHCQSWGNRKKMGQFWRSMCFIYVSIPQIYTDLLDTNLYTKNIPSPYQKTSETLGRDKSGKIYNFISYRGTKMDAHGSSKFSVLKSAFFRSCSGLLYGRKKREITREWQRTNTKSERLTLNTQGITLKQNPTKPRISLAARIVIST